MSGSYAIRRLARHLHVPILAGSVLLVIAFLGSLFYLRGEWMMQEQLKERLRISASMAALHFNGMPLEKVEGPRDMNTPLFREIVARLRSIREQSTTIRYAYIMRRTDDPMSLEFVADADALASAAERDLNHNGIIEPNEDASYPGELYAIGDIPALQGEAFQHATVDAHVAVDQWGATISGYAPIINRQGRVIAVLGVDMVADEFFRLSQEMFSPVAFLLVLLAGVFLASYLALFFRARRIEFMRQVEAERSALIDLALHQIGAPLATLKWWLEILRERDTGTFCTVGDGRNICDEMEEGIHRMGTILQAMSDANQVRRMAMEYHPEDVTLKEIIESVAKEFETHISRRKQELTLETTEGDLTMQLDRKLIAGVVRELLDNAMTYSPPGAHISIRIRRRLGHLQVDVEDTGCGIPAHDLATIFTKFTRGSNATKYKPVGNGLGLFVAKGIVERAGGKMTIHSEEGKGTRVSFTLPV